jgi:anti-sigma factor RsiW
MDCKTTRLSFSEARHGRLAPVEAQERAEHLRSCQDCRQVEQAELALSEVLRERLPRYPASSSLQRQLQVQWLGGAMPVRRSWSLRVALVPFAAAVALTLATIGGYSLGRRHDGQPALVAREAVNDHLRMLESEDPLPVRSSDLHQVKPWFAGRLDFAPPVAFKGDDDYPLVGGLVTRFLEHRAANFVFARRLHKISLFVLPTRALADSGGAGLGTTPRLSFTSRGFSVVSWASGEFAYFLVSDLNTRELLELGRRIESAR